MSKLEKIMEERNKNYGNYEDLAEIKIQILNLLEYTKLPAVHTHACSMIVEKLVRMCLGNNIWHADNPLDIAGYATLLEKYIEKHNEEI